MALEAQLSRAFFLHEDNRRALDVLEPVLEAAEHADLRDVLADALVTRGSALSSLGRLQEGLGVIEVGERLARANGFSYTVMRAINNRAGSLFEFDVQAAIDLCRDGMALARRIGDRTALFSMRALLGWAQQISGDLDGALASFEAGLADEPEPADALILLDGVIVVRAVRGEPVADLLAELERLAAGMTDWNVLWTTVDAPAWSAFCEGRFDDAGRRWREGAARNPVTATAWLHQAAGIALLQGQAEVAAADLAALDASGFHTPFLELQRRRIRAGLAALEGRAPESARGYRDVLGEMVDRGYAWDNALATVEMATLLGPAEPEVVAAAAVARATLERMRARPFLERLDAALAERAGGARTARKGECWGSRAPPPTPPLRWPGQTHRSPLPDRRGRPAAQSDGSRCPGRREAAREILVRLGAVRFGVATNARTALLPHRTKEGRAREPWRRREREPRAGREPPPVGMLAAMEDGQSAQRQSSLRRLAAWAPAIAWAGLIFAFSAQPGLRFVPDDGLDFVVRKLGHMAVYGILALLLWRAVATTTARRWPWAWAVAIAVLYAITDELHQAFVATRHPSPVDVGIDAAGALIAVGTVAVAATAGNRVRRS